MKAVILAAGRGSRLGDLTSNGPKCMVPLNGIPLIERQIASLQKAGIHHISVVTGYAAHRLSKYGDSCFHNLDWNTTGIVQSLSCADNILMTEPIIISYSDIFYPEETVVRLIDVEADIAISFDPFWFDLWKLRFENPISDAETFEVDTELNLLEIGGPIAGEVPPLGQFMGLIKITPNGWAALKGILTSMEPDLTRKVDMTGLLRRALVEGIPVKAVLNIGPWGEIDHPSDIDVYEQLYPGL